MPRILPHTALLACLAVGTPSTEAAIVYVELPGFIHLVDFEPPTTFDLDGNGIDNITFDDTGREVRAFSEAGTRVLGTFTPGALPSFHASNLSAGFEIGAAIVGDEVWASDSALLAGCVSAGGLFCFGNFFGGFEYLGVEFHIAGQTHYGWVGIRSFEFFERIELHSWAYETMPGRSITAGAVPEPSAGLLLLAAGLGWSCKRRAHRRSSVAIPSSHRRVIRWPNCYC